jgi:hypothetical protein
MSPRDQILKEALTLPLADQAFVASRLEDSIALLIAPETSETAGTDARELLTELQRRSANYRNGTTTARDADDVLNDLRDRQQHESKP